MRKICLITGAASGIGYEISKILYCDSHDLILVDKDVKKLKIIQTDFEKVNKNKVLVIFKDLSKSEAANEIFEELMALNISIDILINNAGFGVYGKFSETNWKQESDMIHLHVHSTTNLCKLFLPQMIERGNGKILNVSSLAAFQAGPLMSVYYATKAYLVSFSVAISNELKNTGVSITVLCPGLTSTGFQEKNGKIRSKQIWNSASAFQVANYALKAMNKGTIVAIPGFINRFLANLHRFLPLSTAANIVRKLQEKNRRVN